jgi:glycerol-3-phosphate cytidylyltransferase
MTYKNIIITYGTFDMFHHGHLKILERAKKKGDYLIVGVSTDSFNKLKGKKSIIPYKERKEIIGNIKYVDKVIPEKNWEQKKKDIKKYNVSKLTMGSDWKNSKEFSKINKLCEIEFLPRTKNVSSTKLKEIFESVNENSIKNIEKSLKLLKRIGENFK